jgi:hypothetical protein
MQMEERRLDGNAAGGMLAELFATDATGASATCAGCGRSAPLGALGEYGHGMGVVLRCASCDTAVLRIARTPGRLHVDFSGVSFLMIPVAH